MLKRTLASFSLVVLLAVALVAQTNPKTRWIKVGESGDRTFEVYPEMFQDKGDEFPLGLSRNVFTTGEAHGAVLMLVWDVRCSDRSAKPDSMTAYAPDGEELGTKIAPPDGDFVKMPAGSAGGKMLDVLCAPHDAPARPLSELKKLRGTDA